MEPADRIPTSESGQSWPPGWHVEHVVETTSTNSDLLVRASTGADRTVLFAGHQTAGRGRLDRSWSAPPGANLLVSVLFTEVPDDPSELTRRIGLAAVDVARGAGQLAASLKWPNDVVTPQGKLGGILAQRAGNGAVVVGLGLNVQWAPENAQRLGAHLQPAEVLRNLLEAFDRLPADISDRYRTELSTLGQRVRVELPVGEIVGTAIDVESDGRLIVIDECAISHRVDVGDIVHLRPILMPDP